MSVTDMSATETDAAKGSPESAPSAKSPFENQEASQDSLIKITESAQVYLNELLAKQDKPGTGVRIFVEKPGTPYAECCMSYCEPDAQEADDIAIQFEGFTAWIEKASELFLVDAVVDYSKERFGGQLTFKAPRSKMAQLGEDPTLEDRINYILYSEINPSLAAHGGNVSLVELVDDEKTAVLQFGGGCQGCAAVDITLKQGVEKTLIEQIPELEQVKDVTDHTQGENAYYKQ